jgi:hypothetical protein
VCPKQNQEKEGSEAGRPGEAKEFNPNLNANAFKVQTTTGQFLK